MALFECDTCHAVYDDCYPVDDTCLKCKQGLIRIITYIGSITQLKERHHDRDHTDHQAIH